MTYNEKLNKALEFLHVNQHGSFMYFLSLKDNPNQKLNVQTNTHEQDEKTRLFPYLESIGIKEKEYLPLINQLDRDGYIDSFYKEDADKQLGKYPHQLKITYSGMRLIDEIVTKFFLINTISEITIKIGKSKSAISFSSPAV